MRAADPRLVVTVARGSSDHAATYLKYAVELVAGIPVASVGPSVASIYGRQLRLGGAACLGISQSGQSPDIVEMMRSAARRRRADRRDHQRRRLADGGGLRPRAAAQARAGAERGGDQDLRRLGAGGAGAGRRSGARTTRLRAAVAALPGQFEQALACDWTPLADRLVRANSAFVLGRGPGFAIANEMALKFKETSGIHAESYSAPRCCTGRRRWCRRISRCWRSGSPTRRLPQVIATAERLAGQGADVFLTAPGAGRRGARCRRSTGVHPLTAPLVLVVTFYCFIEALARRRGFNPDTPPHLRKVTETV